MDWFAIVSNGVYPGPTHTLQEMSISAVSNGLLILAAWTAIRRGLNRMGFSTRMD